MKNTLDMLWWINIPLTNIIQSYFASHNVSEQQERLSYAEMIRKISILLPNNCN